MKKQNDKQVLKNEALVDVLAPVGIAIDKQNVRFGDTVGNVLGVTKYPQTSELGWAAKINHCDGSVTCQTFIPTDPTALIEALNADIVKNEGLIDNSKATPQQQLRAQQAVEDGKDLLRRIDGMGETVGFFSELVMPIGANENKMLRSRSRILSTLSGLGFKTKALNFLQEKAFKAMSPCYTNQADLDEMIKTPVPMSTLAGGFPMAATGMTDNRGSWFIKDRNGGLGIIDIWKRGGDRTNSNGVICGGQGLGKSTIAKALMQSEYATGTVIVVIDPDREFKDLCENLGGDWIDCGGGANGKINPLEIKPVPRDNDEDTPNDERIKEGDCLYKDEGNGLGALALHLKTLEVFFELYLPELSEIDKALLKMSLIDLYKNFNIVWETDIEKLKPNDYPVMKDLYDLISTYAEKDERYINLKSLLNDIAVGSDSFIWNGATTVAPKSQFICLDTYQLNGMSDKIKKTQYYNILSWVWERMSRDREERILLFCDEAYLMIDPKVPQSLAFLRNIEKRDRKYEAGLWVISHSVVDFLDPQVKMFGQALLDIPCFKVIMGTDGQNLKELTELYNLKEAEQDLLLAKKRGEAIFVAGSKRLPATFMGAISQKRLKRMGKAGGR